MAMGAQHYTTVVLGHRCLDKEVFELRLARPPQFRCTPGQYLRILHEDAVRDYTILMQPRDAEIILVIRHVAEGLVSPALAIIEPGTQLFFSGPHGYFTYQPSDRPAVMVATGTGIAPFVAMCRNGIAEARLVQGARNPEGLYYASELRSHFRHYVACLSDPEASTGDTVFAGRVTDYLIGELAPGVYDFYVSGPRPLIRDVIAVVDRQFDRSTVFSENFG